MKFDHIIMNPPYCRNLHLKILNEAICYSDDIVNLSPIRWLQDPLAEYKKNSDWRKFENVRNHIEHLDIIPVSEAENSFDLELPFNLGIYHLSEKSGYQVPRNELLRKMVDKIISGETLKDKIVVDDMDGICVVIRLINEGLTNKRRRRHCGNNFMLPKEKCYFNNKKNVYTGKTYLEQRAETAWGVVKVKSSNSNIKFNTEEERNNFYDSWNTKCLKWLFNKQRVDVHVYPQFLPWLGDYTHPWTDEDLYEYFNLTPEEIAIIEGEINETNS